MTILFADGFDHYAEGDVLMKWTAQAGAYFSFTTSTPTGTGQAYLMDSNSGMYFYKDFTASAIDTVFIGMHIKISNYGDNGLMIRLYNGTTLQVQINIGVKAALNVYRSSTTLLESSADFVIRPNRWHWLEAKFYIADSGTYEVRVDGVDVVKGAGTHPAPRGARQQYQSCTTSGPSRL